MHRLTVVLLAVLLVVGCSMARAQNETELTPALLQDPDTQVLQRHGIKDDVTISGVSSGAAMAVQYAVANSASIAGVGSIAGPGWGCAQGSFSKALFDCMCGRNEVPTYTTDAIKAALTKPADLDPLISDPNDPNRIIPKALKRFFVFHSRADATVTTKPEAQAIAFLKEFIPDPKGDVDRGKKDDHSNRAGHGILAPNGLDSCVARPSDKTYIRDCGGHDNAGRLFKALFGTPVAATSDDRATNPKALFIKFKQTPFIKELQAPKPSKPYVASDLVPIGHSNRRLNFDLAEDGYLYVPGACRSPNSQCRIHVALHGCKQDPETFARTAGYNAWADRYHVIVIYPAISAYRPFVIKESSICQDTRFLDPTFMRAFEGASSKLNYNGCWDWWGYLDLQADPKAYLTKRGPQMRFLKMVIDIATY